MPRVAVENEATGERRWLYAHESVPLLQAAENVARLFGVAKEDAPRFVLRSEGVTLRDQSALRTALRLALNNSTYNNHSTSITNHGGECPDEEHPTVVSFCESPVLLAVEMLVCLQSESLSQEQLQLQSRNSVPDSDRVAAVFALHVLIKDPEFFEAFVVARPGLSTLQHLIQTAPPASQLLAYSLHALQTLLDFHDSTHCRKFDNPETFIHTLMRIIESQPVSAASAVLSKLLASSELDTLSDCNAFDHALAFMRTSSPSFSNVLVKRLQQTRDCTLQVTTLSLVNAFLHRSIQSSPKPGPPHSSSSSAQFWSKLFRPVLVAVIQHQPFMNDPASEELKRLLLEFQRLVVKEWSKLKRLPVLPDSPQLVELWTACMSQLDGAVGEVSSSFKWRQIGFETERPHKEVSRVGQFGLDMMTVFVEQQKETFLRFLHDQSVKPAEKRCPFSRACVEVIDILADYFEITSGYTTTTSLQPLLLEFEAIFSTTLVLFFRLWVDMEAQTSNASDDIGRVAATTRFHFKLCMTSCSRVNSFDQLMEFEREMLSTPYNTIRDRQLKELSNEDELMSRQPVRDLREKLYKQNYEFIKEQRIASLLRGAWFPVVKEKGPVKNLYRFYRLSPHRKVLHYGEYRSEGFPKPVMAPVDLAALPHKIDLGHATDVLAGHASPIFKGKRNAGLPAHLCFSLASTSSSSSPSSRGGGASTAAAESMADFVCRSRVELAEWSDALRMLLDRGIGTQETAALILQLTDLEVKTALLAVTGDAIEVPGVVPDVPEAPPPGVPFYYGLAGSEEGLSGLQRLVGELSGLTVEEEEEEE
ncbi:ELMO/CED-12 family-domain-containing protein [Chytriomyces sp. MP71]|nr:ELMO/CED-12 family-domain-containing protein [Chytriomyces sp. MP71]